MVGWAYWFSVVSRLSIVFMFMTVLDIRQFVVTHVNLVSYIKKGFICTVKKYCIELNILILHF